MGVFSDAAKLKPKYYWLTSFVGLAGTFTAIGILYLSLSIIEWVGLGAYLEYAENNTILTIGFFIALIVLFYLMCVLFASIVSKKLVRKGTMTREEARVYTRASQYPKHWYKTN